MEYMFSLIKENYSRGDFEGNGTTLLQSDDLVDVLLEMKKYVDLEDESIINCQVDCDNKKSYDCYYIDTYEVDEDGDAVGCSETLIQRFIESKYWNGKRL